MVQESGGIEQLQYYNCHMKQAKRYALVSEMLHWLTEHQEVQPGLQEISKNFGLSESYLQRTFHEFTGVSPKQFLKHLTKEQALARLRSGTNVFDTSLECGLSGPGRLHDLLVTTEAVTPGEARRGGKGLEISYGNGMTPFGPCLIGWTERGLCFLGFSRSMGKAAAVDELQGQWPAARLVEDITKAERFLDAIFSNASPNPTTVWLRGSPFQLKVWEALLRIPVGSHCTYGQIADFIGQPKASRAVGTAIGSNPVSLLIPCHRVITSLATPGGYRWGIPTKLALIACEASSAAEGINHR